MITFKLTPLSDLQRSLINKNICLWNYGSKHTKPVIRLLPLFCLSIRHSQKQEYFKKEGCIFWLINDHQLTFTVTLTPPPLSLSLSLSLFFFSFFFCGHWEVIHSWNIRWVFSPNSQPSALQYILTFSAVITFSDVSREGKRSYGFGEYRSVLGAHTHKHTHSWTTHTHTHTHSVWPALVLRVTLASPRHSHPVT